MNMPIVSADTMQIIFINIFNYLVLNLVLDVYQDKPM